MGLRRFAVVGSCSLNFKELKLGTLVKLKQSFLYRCKAKAKAAQRVKQWNLETGNQLKCFGFPLSWLF
jgi:hypothetical protein